LRLNRSPLRTASSTYAFPPVLTSRVTWSLARTPLATLSIIRPNEGFSGDNVTNFPVVPFSRHHKRISSRCPRLGAKLLSAGAGGWATSACQVFQSFESEAQDCVVTCRWTFEIKSPSAVVTSLASLLGNDSQMVSRNQIRRAFPRQFDPPIPEK